MRSLKGDCGCLFAILYMDRDVTVEFPDCREGKEPV
jgi:hypothetical protein